MRDVKRARTDNLPLHEHVAAEIRRDVANGDVKPGERLPPAKDMAAVLGVHPNTVLRALRLLRDEGVLEFRRGRGITISGEPNLGVVAAKVRELVVFARKQGVTREDLLLMLQKDVVVQHPVPIDGHAVLTSPCAKTAVSAGPGAYAGT